MSDQKENCSHDCSNCGQECSSREKKDDDFKVNLHAGSSVKKVVAVVSGKGGVGKSLVTSLLASSLQKQNSKTAILDADITGPSIPKCFGIKEKATGTEDSLYPVLTSKGTQIMSINLLLEDDSAPVIWRGPIIAGAVKQFWTDVIWDKVDTMVVDLPPGTGDVPLTVFQSIPVNGIIIVTSPQDLVSMIVEKAVQMARMMNIPILGIVENMSYVVCPDCGKEIHVFGESHIQDIAKKYNLEILGRIPMDPELAKLCDAGKIEEYEKPVLSDAVKKINSLTVESK